MLLKNLKLSLALVSLFSFSVYAGFLELPDTTEAPDFEQRTMLTDMDVPGVKDRDPDPQGGPRLNVKEFKLQGVVEYPEFGITRTELIKRVEAIRFDLMSEDQLLSDGYTEGELSEISDLLGSIEEETKGEHVGPLDVQKLVFLIREQRRKRGVTLGMIETVADTITRYYRERGFILAKAYIPKQEVRDGVVTLTLLLGDLGEVDIINNKRYSPAKVKSVFRDILEKPVTNKLIEERLYLINDLPGISAQGFFQPGTQVGDTKLAVNVLSERWYDANIRLDNHGTEQSGENRVFADFTLNNPLGIGDSLNIGLLQALQTDGTTYGSIRYNANFFGTRLRSTIAFSKSEFFVSPGQTLLGEGFTGESEVADAGLTYKIRRSRTKNLSAGISLSAIDTSINFGGFGSDASTYNNELFVNFDRLNEEKRVLHSGKAAIVFSAYEPELDEFDESDEDRLQQGDVAILRVDYSRLSFNKIPFTDIESRVVAKASLQYVGSTLDAVSKFDLTGPSRARGYDITLFSVDDALLVGADWIFKLPSSEKRYFGQRLDRAIQPYLAFDIGLGQQYQAVDNSSQERQVMLANVGAGLKLNFGRGFRGNLIVSQPVYGKEKIDFIPNANDTEILPSETVDVEDNGVKFYFDVQYAF